MKSLIFNLRNFVMMVAIGCLLVLSGQDGSHAYAQKFSKELIVNGGMESDGGWDGINIGTPTLPKMIKRTTRDKHSGQYALMIEISRDGQEWPGVRSAPVPTNAGGAYQVRFWAKVVKGSVSLAMRNSSAYVTLVASNANDPEWREYTTIFHETADTADSYLCFMSVGNETKFYLDDVSVQRIEESPQAVAAQWQAFFPGDSYVCWQKTSPWNNLNRLQQPPKQVQYCRNIDLDMGRNEYESASFVLTNTSDEPIDFSVTSETVEGISTTLRKGVWVTSHTRRKVNDALALLNEKITIPSSESREIWLTLHSNQIKPGQYKIPITITANGLPPHTVDLSVTIHNVSLPDEMPLYTYYWDYTTPQWHGAELAEAFAKDLKQHYTNVAVVHPWFFPRIEVDEEGYLRMDYTEFDTVMDAYKQNLDPKIYFFSWNPDVYLEDLAGKKGVPEFMTPPWKELFKDWVKQWVAHLHQRGLSYDQFVVNPYDELANAKVLEMLQLIKEADPQVNILIDHIGNSVEEVKNIAPYVDVWCPLLQDYENVPPYDRDYDVKASAKTIFSGQEDTAFWTYANPNSSVPEESLPYQDYRLSVWKAWRTGMAGYGYWIYCYGSHWDGAAEGAKVNWSVAYRTDTKDCPPDVDKSELVVPGKRWEATREGVEDYAYLYLLNAAINNSELDASAKNLVEAKNTLETWTDRVLREPNNPHLAGQAKRQVMIAIQELSPDE